MKIRNNTHRRLKFYFGDTRKEDPEAIITLEVGQVIDFDYDPEADFIIQED